MALDIGIKEWAGVIAAMGRGDQLILIRKYAPGDRALLLFPTHSYYSSGSSKKSMAFERKIQPVYRELAREAALSELADASIVRLQFFFEVEQVVHITEKALLPILEPYMIWSTEHVSEYFDSAKAAGGLYVWLGQTYRLQSPASVARQSTRGSISVFRLHESVDTAHARPCLEQTWYSKMSCDLVEALSTGGASFFQIYA